MEQTLVNPFTPRFGRIPPRMAGRGDIIEPLFEAFEGELNSPDLTSIFVGARGTGKTALFSYLALDELEKSDVGLLVTVDEVDPEVDEMNQLAATYQHFVREDRKAALLMTSLPSNR